MTPKTTPQKIVNAWDEIHSRPAATDWELLPVDNLKKFFDYIRLDLTSCSSVLDIGCGKGQSLLHWIEQDASINRDNVSVVGLDWSHNAVKFAAARLEEIRINKGNAAIRPNVQFVCGDAADMIPKEVKDRKFDIIIDWMCLHDTFQPSYQSVVKNICRMTSKIFVSCSFLSGADAEPEGYTRFVHNNENITKRRFGAEDYKANFGGSFELLRDFIYVGDVDPSPVPTDRFVAPKCAYCFIRRPTS